jgi:NitT/TauT family transport system substrate-binding protein
MRQCDWLSASQGRQHDAQIDRRRRALLALPALLVAQGAQAAPRRSRLVFAGPPASVSNGLIEMVERGALEALAERVEFVAWRDPDQLRVLVLDQRADFVATPTNVAANLYNRGAEIGLINVATWGVLWLVSRDPALKTLADFKGKEIAVPFRGDMPDIVLGLLAQRQGLDLRRDLRIRYVATPLEAMQLLLARQVEHALLTEPAVSMALRRVRTLPVSVVAPELHRSVDLQAEWGRLLKREPRIPQAGIAAVGAARTDAALVAQVQRAYTEAVASCQSDPAACGARVARRHTLLAAEAVADAIGVAPDRPVPAAAARAELEFFFGELLQRQPGLVGGKLPDDGFYLRS